MPASTSATTAATMILPRTELTVVLGSVTMKKTNSWYIGPVSGAISASSGPPVITLRTPASATKHTAYVSVTCRSEEHTSELQSQSNLVCRLLLEKKKDHLRATIHL